MTELQAIRERDAFITNPDYAFGHAENDRRTLLALCDAQSATLQQEHQDRVEAQCSEERWRSKSEAQSDEVRRLREALLSAYRHMQSIGCHETYLTTQRALLKAGGYKFDDKEYYIGSQP